ncbi:MAG: ABC transporter permease [Lysobacterales bacterium]|nr:ABC transporter permease [Rhodanobacteraceae bacterium]
MTHGSERITILEPPRSLFSMRLGELWDYRDLIYLLVRRDFVAQYKQTMLGPAWHVIQPLFTTIIFTLVFGTIAKISTDGVPPFLFYMAGTTLWAYFSGVLTTTANTFIGNASIFGKVYFPRLVVPVSNLISKLIGFAIQMAFFLAFIGWYWLRGAPIEFQPTILLFPLLVLMMASFSLALGVIISALTTRYRDLAVVLTFGVQLYMYVTPIVYPVSTLSPDWQTWAMVNPMAPIVETFRHGILGAGTYDPFALLLSGATILLTLLLGVALFNRVERTFMDTV